ncbi:MAG: hypothetical protein Q8P73_04490 [bacterium]|nr:hypothetical protein [bacterium]
MKLRLRGIGINRVGNAAGARGLFGDGYWYHKYLRPFGLNWDGATLFTKTATWGSRRGPDYNEPGNMRMTEDGKQPKERFPDCIKVYPVRRMALNSVGLSGPSLDAVLADGRWQVWPETLVISVMALGETMEARLADMQRIVRRLKTALPGWRSPVVIEINISCPNVCLDLMALVREAWYLLDIAAELDVPLIIKLNACTPAEAVKKISDHLACDAISVTNTIPWWRQPVVGYVDWMRLFGTDISPLAKYKGGGLSGAPLLPIIEQYIKLLLEIGVTVPIIGGGGVLCCRDADRLIRAGASAISLGSIAMLAPWEVRRVISHVKRRYAAITRVRKPAWERRRRVLWPMDLAAC